MLSHCPRCWPAVKGAVPISRIDLQPAFHATTRSYAMLCITSWVEPGKIVRAWQIPAGKQTREIYFCSRKLQASLSWWGLRSACTAFDRAFLFFFFMEQVHVPRGGFRNISSLISRNARGCGFLRWASRGYKVWL